MAIRITFKLMNQTPTLTTRKTKDKIHKLQRRKALHYNRLQNKMAHAVSQERQTLYQWRSKRAVGQMKSTKDSWKR